MSGIARKLMGVAKEAEVFYYPLTNTSSDPTSSFWSQPPGYTFIPNDGIYTTQLITDMSSMFYAYGTSPGSFNDPDIALWDMFGVLTVFYMFAGQSDFNQNIGSWNTSTIVDMNGMFFGTTSFNQDLTGWCVTNISTEPSDFATDSALDPANYPIWGTCP